VADDPADALIDGRFAVDTSHPLPEAGGGVPAFLAADRQAVAVKRVALAVSRDAPHWRAEGRRFRIEAADAFAPSMRQRIDVADLYAKALRSLPEASDGQPPLPVPVECPVTLDEMLADA